MVLEMLPPTRDSLELHTICANYQAKIWLQADKEHISVPILTDTAAWEKVQVHHYKLSGQDCLPSQMHALS